MKENKLKKNVKERIYEAMFMIDPTKTAEQWEKIKNEILKLIKKRGGKIISAKKWGERKLAYEVNGHKRASYLLIYFSMSPSQINELRRDIQLSELVMRTLILLLEKEAIKKLLKETEGEKQAEEKEKNN